MPTLFHLLRSNAKFKHLQLLVVVNELRHVRHVAELLQLSRSAVSKALAALESLVGTALFERTRRGLIPTDQGLLYVDFARETLARMERLRPSASSA